MIGLGEISAEQLWSVAEGLVSDRWQGVERELKALDISFLLQDFIGHYNSNVSLIGSFSDSDTHPAIQFLFETLAMEVDRVNESVLQTA